MSHLLFINHTRQLHGSEQVMLHSMRVAQAAGHRVTAVLPSHVADEGLDAAVEAYASRVLRLPYRPIGIGWWRTMLVQVYNLYALCRLVRYICREKVDVVYSNTSVTSIGVRAARWTGRKHLWHFHEPVDKLYGWNATLKGVYRRLLGTKRNTLICISKRQLGEWEQAVGQSLPAMVVYNPVREIQVKRVAHKGGRIGFLGCFETRKNIPVLLRAVERISETVADVQLVLCGAKNEEEKRAIYRQTTLTESSLDVRLHTNDVAAFFGEIDILVLPSLQETMPLVVMEALQAGVCVIQTTHSGLSELLRDGEDTLFFAPERPETLVALLRTCMDGNVRERLAANGQRRVKELDCNKRFEVAMQQLFAL